MLVAALALALQGQPGLSVLEGRELVPVALVAPTVQNGYDDLVEAFTQLDANGTTTSLRGVPQVGDPEWLASRRSVVDGCSRSLELVHTALSKDVTFAATEENLKNLYLHTEGFSRLGQILTFRAAVACADGHPDRAANALAEGLFLSRKLTFVGGRDHYFAGRGVALQMLSEFSHDKRQFTPKGLETIEKAIEALLADRDTIHVVTFQGDLEVSMVRGLTDDLVSTLKAWGLDDVSKLRSGSPAKVWYDMTNQERKAASDECLKALKDRDDHAKAALALPESEWDKAGVSNEPPVSKMHVFEPLDWGNWLDEEATVRTRLRLAKLECKILAHRWQSGGLPSDLKSVADAKSLTDPRTGKAYLYQIVIRDFKLWAESVDGTTKFDMNGNGVQIERELVEVPKW